jgi:hypothetical protein
MPPTPASIRHNTTLHRFEFGAENATALLDYTRDGATVTFTHTFVPPELRGKGLAEQLARAALEWVRNEKVKIVAQCSYVARFLERHHEYDDLRL